MAKTLDEAGVKRLIREIKGANKNLNTPIPISTENTPESIAQNVKNIADYVEKAKAAGMADVNGMAVTCLIDGENSGVGYLYVTNTQVLICGILPYEDSSVSCITVIDGTYGEQSIVVEGHIGQVTSDMLVEGARKPIILTPSTTEVDEETYQKLLSDDVDVIADFGEGVFIESQAKFNTGDKLNFVFEYSQFDESEQGIIAADTISINTSAPHTLTLAIGACQPVSKLILTPVLQEIDLTGTDADRKAKLDQFETDWKKLTGASNLEGARFVGLLSNDINIITCLLTFNNSAGRYTGVSAETSEDEVVSKIAVGVDGAIYITPLFSHLEAITIKTGNTPDDKAANVAAIKAYVDNLTALGVDVTKGYMIPTKLDSGNLDGFVSYHSDTVDYPWSGVFIKPGGSGRFVGIDKNGLVVLIPDILISGNIYKTLTTTSKGIIPAINEINANAVHSDKLVPTLEAITIYTDNTPEHKQANLANIAAYAANLQALGVDVTKGYMIPIRTSSEENIVGFIIPNMTGTGYVGLGDFGNGNGITLYISNDGNFSRYRLQEKSDDDLTTTTNNIVGAINEVNALAKGYSTIFTPIELTTETAQNKTAIDARVAAFTAQGISLTNGCCIPVTYKGVYAGNISLLNGDWYGLLVKNTNNPADNINIKLSADGTITEGNSAQ